MVADLTLWSIFYRLSEFIAAPYINPGMLWFGLPLILMIIFAELYLDLRKRTNAVLVGNIAMLNAIAMLFVAIDVLRLAFLDGKGFIETFATLKLWMAILILVLAAVLFLLDAIGKFPRKTFLKLSAHLPFNITAYAAMVVAYNNLPLDLITIISWILLIVFFWIVFFLVTLIKFKFKEKDGKKGLKKKGFDF